MSLNHLNNFVMEQANIFQQIQLNLKNNNNHADLRQNDNLLSLNSKLVKQAQPQSKQINEVGIMSKYELKKIFQRKKSEVSLNITAHKKDLLKTIMSKKDLLNDEISKKISYFNELFKEANHNNIKERYSFADVMFNQQLSDSFRQQCEREHCSADFLFIQDLKSALKNPNLEALREIYINYCQSDSYYKISISLKTRGGMEKIFRSNAGICQLLEYFKQPVQEILHSLKGIYLNYRSDGMKDAVRVDCLNIKSVSGRTAYLNNLINSNHVASYAAKNMIREDREKMFTDFRNKF